MTVRMTLKRHRRRFAADDRGATAIEYALMIALIAIGVLAALQSTGSATGENWTNIADKSGKAMNGAGN
jgi:pilus assembly protein Flp/PilA